MRAINNNLIISNFIKNLMINMLWVIILGIIGIIFLIIGTYISRSFLREYKYILGLSRGVYPEEIINGQRIPTTIGVRVYELEDNIEIISL